MGGVNGVPGQTLEQKKKLLWGAKKAETVQTVSMIVHADRESRKLDSICAVNVLLIVS